MTTPLGKKIRNSGKGRYNKLRRLGSEIDAVLGAKTFDELTIKDIADLRDLIVDATEAFYEFNAYRNSWLTTIETEAP